jgi:hypothetical protein
MSTDSGRATPEGLSHRVPSVSAVWQVLIGRPLKSSEARHGEITPLRDFRPCRSTR